MTTTTCPNCGKPLRPGTKFCGNCGSTISAVTSTKAEVTPQREQPAPLPVGGLCPHCGKPLRLGAKFCNNCGKPVTEAVQAPGAGPQIPQSSKPTVGIKPAPTAPASVARPAPAATPKREPAGKRVWAGLLVSILSILCVVVLAAGYVYWKNPFGWFGKTRGTPVVSETAITELVTGTPEPGINLTTTITIIPPETTSSLEATTPPVGYTPAIETPSVTPDTSMVTITTTAAAQQSTVIFEDSFDGGINSNWKPWGKAQYYPSIKRGPEGGWLELIAYENSGSAGVTSKSEINSSAGTEIEFEAQLNPNYPQFPLIFDWDPLNNPRTINSESPGVVHFEINTDKLILKSLFNQQSTCTRPINGARKRKYFIKFTENQGVLMSVEGDLVEPCSIPDIGQPSMKGRITFTGMGWVMYVRVTTPQ
jgi:uncharacterized Zn finger protein (UPF0148 family)